MLKPKKEKTVRAYDGILVLDVPKAKTPAVIRFKMNDVALAQFHVRSNDQGSLLGFSSGRDDFNVLAIFADRMDAENALADIRAALLHPACHKHVLSRRTLLIILGVLVAFMILRGIVNNYGSLPPVGESIALEEPMMPQTEPGMPIDADSKLAPPH